MRASSSARWTPRRSPSCSSWVRQEKPSARTTAPAAQAGHRGQQLLAGDGHRDVVVAALHAPVAGEAAAPAEPGDGRAGVGQQGRVGGPAQDRVVVAVGLGDDLHARPGAVVPSPGVLVSSSASVRVPAATRAAAGSSSSSVASPRSTAVQDGSSPTTGMPASTSGTRASHGAAQDRPVRRRAGRWRSTSARSRRGSAGPARGSPRPPAPAPPPPPRAARSGR